MTIADNAPRVQYTATGGQTAFSYTFEILAQTDLKVYQNGTLLALSTNYTVSGVGNQNGGTVTLTSGATAGDTIVIYRDMAISRTTDYQLGARLNPDTLDADLDRVVLGLQQVERDNERAIRMPVTDTTAVADMELPSASTRASKYLQFDADGKVTVSTGTTAAPASAASVDILDAGSLYASTQVENALQEIGTAARTFQTIALLKAGTARYANERVTVLGYYTAGDGGGGPVRYWSSSSTATHNGGSVIAPNYEPYISTPGTAGRWLWECEPGEVWAEWFGMGVGQSAATNTTALLAAIASLRANAVTILDDIGGVNITAYSSGVVNIGAGLFNISPDAILISQDLGLSIRGRGSRRSNNAVKAATILNVADASSGYAIKASNSGARGLTLEDFDLQYSTASFTGHLLDTINTPGITLTRMFIGSQGGTTRYQTAASCVRVTYHEFIHMTDCVFDGAVDGVWFDDARSQYGNTFGGTGATFENCVWYDFTGDMVRHDGSRTTTDLALRNCYFNPISVDCARSIDLNNVDGLVISGGGCGGSVSNKASSEWMRLVNCTGTVHGTHLNDLSPAGTLNGFLDISGNRIFCTTGFTLTGGVITGRANEFSDGASGWMFAPTETLCFDLGPDLFKAAVDNSYYVTPDSAFLSGRINYCREQDASVNKFTNVSARVSVRSIDRNIVSASGASYAISRLDTGRIIRANGGVGQTFSLPTPAPGLAFTVLKDSTQALQIATSAGALYAGTGALKTAIEATAASDVGGVVSFESFGAAGWMITSLSGNWTVV